MKLLLVFVPVIYQIAASAAFGIWQHSIAAGLFVFFGADIAARVFRR